MFVTKNKKITIKEQTNDNGRLEPFIEFLNQVDKANNRKNPMLTNLVKKFTIDESVMFSVKEFDYGIALNFNLFVENANSGNQVEITLHDGKYDVKIYDTKNSNTTIYESKNLELEAAVNTYIIQFNVLKNVIGTPKEVGHIIYYWDELSKTQSGDNILDTVLI